MAENLSAKVLGELVQFRENIEKCVDGGSQGHSFQKQCFQLELQFRERLAETRPVLVLSPPIMQSSTTPISPCSSVASTPTPVSKGNRVLIAIDSDEDDTEVKPGPNHRSSQKRLHTPSQSLPNRKARTMKASPQTPRLAVKVQSKRFTLEDVRQIIQDTCITLPGQYDPKATEAMIQDSMCHWQSIVDDFLEKVKDLCINMVFEQFTVVFGHHHGTAYYTVIRDLCQTFVENIYSEQREFLNRVLRWELSKPKTLNDEALNTAREKAYNMLQLHRQKLGAIAVVEGQEKKNGKLSTGQIRADRIAKITDSQLSPETFSLEIEAMSVRRRL